jgi:hypothetical protein
VTWQERAALPEVRVARARAAYHAAVDACLRATPGSVELDAAFAAVNAAERELDLADWLADDRGMLDDAEVVLVLYLVAGAIRGRVRDATALRVLGLLDRGLMGPIVSTPSVTTADAELDDPSDSTPAAVMATRRTYRAA